MRHFVSLNDYQTVEIMDPKEMGTSPGISSRKEEKVPAIGN